MKHERTKIDLRENFYCKKCNKRTTRKINNPNWIFCKKCFKQIKVKEMRKNL